MVGFSLKQTVLILAVILAFESSSSGQSLPRLTVKQPDGEITIPVASGVLGQKDPGAIVELTNHLKAIGLSPWTGMQGTGEISFGKDVTSYSATLSNLGDDRFRLDATTKHGAMSIRVHGRAGKVQNGDGPILPIVPDAAALTLFPFELLRSTGFPRNQDSLIDHGLVTVGNVQLHRITLERQTFGRNPVTKSPETVVIDFYFDPNTHLLTKSVILTRITEGRAATFVFVVNYGDYHQVGGSLIPYLYTETMEGEPYWKLQLSNVQLNPSIPSTYFEF